MGTPYRQWSLALSWDCEGVVAGGVCEGLAARAKVEERVR